MLYNSIGKKSLLQVVLGSLTLGALGVVYGDIGTSPLYAMRESLHFVEHTPENILGITSLLFWAMTLIVSILYATLVVKVDHRGEGGITALITLLKRKVPRIFIILGIFGIGLLLADGAITPAISVLSAVEGLNVISPTLNTFVLPATIAILIGLFSVQRFGTAKVGMAFGPIMVLWFITIGAFGLLSIMAHPAILLALNPWHGISFLLHNRGHLALIAHVLGAIVLVVTGGEALYADLGHFGKAAIRKGWFVLAMPALALNYFGQGAAILGNPELAHNPFYAIVPPAFTTFILVISTIATIIASQALISASFSLAKQLVVLRFLPYVDINATHKEHHGQIYISLVNWVLFLGTIGFVLGFRSSSAIAGAYGLAVTGTMTITVILFYLVLTRLKKWSTLRAGLLISPFFIIVASLFIANTSKLFQGGLIPVMVALALSTIFISYYRYLQTRLHPQKKVEPMHIKGFKPHKAHAIMLEGNVVDQGTLQTLATVKALGVPYEIVHVANEGEDHHTIDEFFRKIGEKKKLTILHAPSGNLTERITEYVQEQKKPVWVFASRMVPGMLDMVSAHITEHIEKRLESIPGVNFVVVQWKSENGINKKI